MKVIGSNELDRLVRDTFPRRPHFCAAAELGLRPDRPTIVPCVHGGPDPFLDRHFDAWLEGSAAFVALYQLLNRLCRAGTLAPGDYAVTRRA
jgi:hypothetical protein